MGNRSKNNSQLVTVICIIAAAALILFIVLVGLQTLDTMNTYKKEAAITPTPSITPRPVEVTRDPTLPTPAPTEFLLRSGVEDDEVKTLQARLKELGYYSGEVDGQFGPATKASVKLFQQQHSLDADGIAGAKTKEVLYSDKAHYVTATATPATVNVLGGSMPLLVNRQNTIAPDFVPNDLVKMRDVCPEDVVYIKGTDIMGQKTAVNALLTMLRAAVADGLGDWQISAGYRSYEYQKNLFDNKVAELVNNGQTRQSAITNTSKTVADPGASEHHTGLAFDITVKSGDAFSTTKQYQWLHEHSWEYGFVQRYQSGKEAITGFSVEAWHYRYVGQAHAKIMHDEDLCLEEYITKYGAAQ